MVNLSMAKTGPIFDYLKNRRADGVRSDMPPGDTPEHRMPIQRLSWGVNLCPPECSDVEFAKTVQKSALPDAQFYLDTCFITGKEVDPQVWEALLGRSIVLTHDTWQELGPWLENPHVNKDFRDTLVSAFKRKHPSIRFDDGSQNSSELESATHYYVRLLSLRKEAFAWAEIHLEHELGRKPTLDEINAFTQQIVQDRGMELARKGHKDKGKPNFYADEAVLARATVSAISTGRETAVLTRDSDLVEQFYKLLYLVDTHYRSFLIGHALKKQPLNFVEGNWPTDSKYFNSHYEDGRVFLLPANANDRFLPEQCDSVMIYVYRFSPNSDQTTMQSLAFCAEQQMLPLLETKGTADGRSTTLFDDWNFHRCISPYHQQEIGAHGALAIDKSIEIDGVTLSATDIELTMSRTEGISRVAISEPSADVGSKEDLDTAMLWSHLRCDQRLSWFPPRDPIATSESTIAKTIQYLPFHSRVYLDQSMLTAPLAREFRDALQQTGIGTTETIVDSAKAKIDKPKDCFATSLNREGYPKWLHPMKSPPFPEPYFAAHQQYVALLAFRKLIGRIVRRQLTEKLQRMPSEDEWKEEIESIRGDHLERSIDAEERANDVHYYAEDELVVSAVLDAIVSGCDLVLLTKSRIVQQQFISFVLQLDLHYRAWSLALHERRQGVDLAKLTEPDQQFESLGYAGAMSVRGVSFSYVKGCLPEEALSLQLQCWVLQGSGSSFSFQPVGFLAERPMHALLRTRGETNGRNTKLLGSEDLQFFWRRENGHVKGVVARGELSSTSIGSKKFPRDDRLHLSVDEVPTKDLISIANYCDFPNRAAD